MKKRRRRTKDEPTVTAQISLTELARLNPEARAHLMRIESMLNPRVIQNQKVQDVLHAQVTKVMLDVHLNGVHVRDPKDDRELMLIVNEAIERLNR